MDKPPFEVADVIRSLVDANGVVPGLRVTGAQQRVLDDIAACRTAKLGGHVEICDACGLVSVAYNSCRNRHCPRCQGQKRAEWLEARQRDLLPIPYFHVVFTLLAELAPLALQNKREIYSLLFQSAATTLKEIAADPRHLGAEIGFIAVLHTWGQTLAHHPHLHCVVPGGGLSLDGLSWIASRENFLVSVRVLSRRFRTIFINGLRAAFHNGRLQFHGKLAELADPAPFTSFCAQLREKEWVVYAKPPFGGPKQVLKYLARYTHRVAISNHRIISVDNATVGFRYKDYAHGNAQRIMKLSGLEFIRRFLLHVLPDGFVRIRHYGLLANRCRRDKLARCRELFAPNNATDPVPAHRSTDTATDTETETRTRTCATCGATTIRTIQTFGPQPGWSYEPTVPPSWDSS